MIYSLTIRNMALVRKYQFDAQNLDEKNAHKLDHQTTMKLIVKQHDLIFILIWLVREEKLSRQNKVETKRFRSMKENCELWEAVWVIRQGWGLTPGWPASWAAWQAGGGGGGGGGVQQVRCSPFTRSLVVASGARVWWRWKRLYRRPHNRAATLTGSKGSGHKDTCSAWHHHPPSLWHNSAKKLLFPSFFQIPRSQDPNYRQGFGVSGIFSLEMANSSKSHLEFTFAFTNSCQHVPITIWNVCGSASSGK